MGSLGRCSGYRGHHKVALATMRVVLGIDNLGDVGGTELHCFKVASLLAWAGHDVHIIALAESGPMRSRYEQLGLRVHSISAGSLYGRRALSAVRSAQRILNEVRPDVVHANDIFTSFFLSIAGRLAAVPCIIVSRRWSSVKLRHQLASLAGFLFAHFICCNSRSVGRTTLLPRSKVAVIENIVPACAFEVPIGNGTPAWRGAVSDELAIGMVARFRPEKDHATAIHGFAQAVSRGLSAKLFLFGDGDSSELRMLIRRLGLTSRVVFAGAVSPCPNPALHYDVALLTSLHEGFPNALCEAMAAGRPVIATAVGGIPDIFENAKVGILIPPKNPGAVADALAVLADSVVRRAYGAHARALALDRFSESLALRKLIALYRRHPELDTHP